MRPSLPYMSRQTLQQWHWVLEGHHLHESNRLSTQHRVDPPGEGHQGHVKIVSGMKLHPLVLAVHPVLSYFADQRGLNTVDNRGGGFHPGLLVQAVFTASALPQTSSDSLSLFHPPHTSGITTADIQPHAVLLGLGILAAGSELVLSSHRLEPRVAQCLPCSNPGLRVPHQQLLNEVPSQV